MEIRGVDYLLNHRCQHKAGGQQDLILKVMISPNLCQTMDSRYSQLPGSKHQLCRIQETTTYDTEELTVSFV